MRLAAALETVTSGATFEVGVPNFAGHWGPFLTKDRPKIGVCVSVRRRMRRVQYAVKWGFYKCRRLRPFIHPPFHGGNTGSSSVGRANDLNNLHRQSSGASNCWPPDTDDVGKIALKDHANSITELSGWYAI